MPPPERIVAGPGILAGKPVIRGTRLAVEFILELLAAGQSGNDVLANYPGLTREDILACLSYASYLAHEYKAFPIPAQMRLLADENFPKPVVEALRTDGHDVLWAGTDLAGTSGGALLDLAESEARIVLTVLAFDSTDAVAVRRLARIQNISQELRFHAVNVAFADSPFERGAPLFYCQLPHFIGH